MPGLWKTVLLLAAATLTSAASQVEIASQTFRVSVLEDGSFQLSDKVGRTEYKPDPWGEGAGSITLIRGRGEQRRPQTLSLSKADEIRRVARDGGIDIAFAWKQGLEVRTRFAFEGDALVVTVEKIVLPAGTRLERLVYPSRFAALTTGENGYLILPARGGAIIPSHFYTRIGGEFWRMDDAYRQLNPNGVFLSFFGQLAFNFFGVQKADSGLTFICDRAFDAGLQVFANTRGNRYKYEQGRWSMPDPIAAISPVWEASLGELGYPRRLTIRRHGKEGYVESARIYRRWMDESGWSRTFADKIKQNADRDKLIGSTHIDIYGGYPHYTPEAPKAVDFTFDQITAIVDSLDRELKLDRASITVWGTFENYPPNSWPINERRGGLAAWKRAVDRAKQAGYLITGYHSYLPQEEHDPRFDPRLIFQMDPDNPDLVRRVVSLPRWRRTCTSLSLEYAKRNLPKELDGAGQNGDFTDILGVSSGIECYDTTHHRHTKPLTREEDKRLRNAVFAYMHDDLNLVNWQENGTAPDIRTMDAFHGAAEPALDEIAVPAPLSALVAHDCVVLRQHPGQSYRNDRGQFYFRALLNILEGNPPIHSLQAWEFEGRKKDIARFHSVAARIHRQVGLAKMTGHQFLPGPGLYDTDNFLVQKSVFSDGTEIYVNFGLDPYEAGGVTLEPYGFEARLAGGEVLKGSVQCDLQLR